MIFLSLYSTQSNINLQNCVFRLQVAQKPLQPQQPCLEETTDSLNAVRETFLSHADSTKGHSTQE